jgi:predicted Rossmann fold nucleotide-binding protein DprA/Smf involved in DNA uptake
VERGGAYLSLLEDEEPAPLGGFFVRNACLVALVHAVVVVEARYRSGARNAAKWARRLGRPLLAVPASPWRRRGAGCNVELRLGARVCTDVNDVLRELERGLVVPPGTAREKKVRHRPIRQQELVFPDETTKDIAAQAVLRAIRGGATHLDAVCEVSGLPAAVVQSHVLTLTLEGVLVADPALGLGARPVIGSVSVRNRKK